MQKRECTGAHTLEEANVTQGAEKTSSTKKYDSYPPRNKRKMKQHDVVKKQASKK